MTIDSVTSAILPPNNRSAAHLKQYQFKPGNNANPAGRPKAIVTKKEKLEILSEIARHTIESAVSAGHKIAAIREANLMENVYLAAGGGYQDNRQINIIIAGAESKELLQRVGQTFLPALQVPGETKEEGKGEPDS